jgi:hypothetical protein
MHSLATPVIQRNIKSYDGSRLNKVIEFTFKEFQRPITLKEVAAWLILHPKHFVNTLKQEQEKHISIF